MSFLLSTDYTDFHRLFAQQYECSLIICGFDIRKRREELMEKKKMNFAGAWYPASAQECESAIKEFIKQDQGPLTGNFVGGIVPHAGWYFSGSIACRVIASLQSGENSDNKTDTIILFGAHMHVQSEPFILGHGALETPFGDIEVDTELTELICDAISIRKREPSKFPDENTLELQYPFIRYFFPNSKIVVMGVAPSSFAAIIGDTTINEALKLSRKIRIIGSTDMSHYGPNFGFTPVGTGEKAVEWVSNTNDRSAIDAMIDMDEEKIIKQGLSNHNMCCPGAAAATAVAAKKLGAVRGTELEYATSYEKSASSSFVGYAGILYDKL
jgi:MEMO1 family protein